jgi:hypothetical protein
LAVSATFEGGGSTLAGSAIVEGGGPSFLVAVVTKGGGVGRNFTPSGRTRSIGAGTFGFGGSGQRRTTMIPTRTRNPTSPEATIIPESGFRPFDSLPRGAADKTGADFMEESGEIEAVGESRTIPR